MELLFEEALESYKKYLNLKDKPQSVKKILSRINCHILPYFKGKNIYNLNVLDYLNWQITINGMDLRYSYKKTLHYCFVSFLNYCIKFLDLKENIASKVGNFKNDNVEIEGAVWNIDEFNNFIKCVDDKIYHTLFDFLYFTGVRLGEASALTFNDIDNYIIKIDKTITKESYNGQRLITTPKTKKSIRKICIDNKLKVEIDELRSYYSTHFNNFNNNFFIFGGNKPIAPTTVTRKKNQWCKLANVKQIKIHEFRHSHACLLFQNNIPIEDISKRLGHSNISMTMNTYLRYIPGNEKRVLNTLNRLRLAS